MWQPNEGGLAQIVEVFRNAHSRDNRVQEHVGKKLIEFASIPDYSNYLAHIMATSQSEQDSVRATAGLVLKNNIKSSLDSDLTYVKHCCLASIGDKSNLVRAAVGNVVTTIASQSGLERWPELLPRLMDLLSENAASPQIAEGAFSAMHKICEDSGAYLTNSTTRPLDVMIPRFIQLADSPHTPIRVYALSCVNEFFVWKSEALFQNVESYIHVLSRRSTDDSAAVRKLVCNAFVMMLDSRPDIIVAQLASVSQFILHAMQDNDEKVSLEAAEFWLTFAEQEKLRQFLFPLFPTLLPILLKNMMYTEDAILMLGGDENHVVDKDEDIKPLHHKSKTREINRTKAAGSESETDLDEESDDDNDDDEAAEWNMRKCCAATVDVSATSFGASILSIFIPLLNQFLFSDDWKHREAGILALGAIADGCMSGIEQYLPQLVPYLFEQLEHPKPLVRSITCWTLSRYAGWCVESHDATGSADYFQPLLRGLLSRILDPHKKVQEAACSAFASMEEEAMESLVPFLDHIVPVLSSAFKTYQKKNLIILYDALSTLAECVESALAETRYVDMIMQPLIEKWNSLADDDTGLFPLFECLSSVAIALGKAFLPFAGPVYDRCVRLVQRTLSENALHLQNTANDPPDMDFLIVALDLLSGIAQGLGEASLPLIQQTQPSLLELIKYTINDSIPEIRQSSFALVGDLAAGCFNELRPHLPELVPAILHQINCDVEPADFPPCNNACWAVGEIALRLGSEMQPFGQSLMERLIVLLGMPDIGRTLQENAAISLGRLCVALPNVVAPHLDKFAPQFIKVLRHTLNNPEKESAYRGFCQIVALNPSGLLPALSIFCDTVGHWTVSSISPEMRDIFKRVLGGYKSMMGVERWCEFVNKLPPALRDILADYI